MTSAQPVAPPPMSGSAQRWILGLASLASFMISLDSLVVTTALDAIRRDFGAPLEGLEWTVNAYNLSFAVLLLTGAALGDRFGRKRMFATGLGIFTVASAGCALATSVGLLIAARAVQGVGAALMLPLALTLISTAFPPQQRGKAIGIFMGVTGIATFSGPFVGGAMTQGISWEWIFWINLPIGAVAIALVAAKIKESTGPNNRFDLLGVALATVGAFGVVWGLVRGNTAGWGSAEVLTALVLGVLLLAGFVVWETRAPAPMLPMRFFRVRAFTTANLANFGLFGSLYVTLFFLAQFLQVTVGHDALGAGLRLMPWTATLMVLAPVAGALVDKFGERTFMVGGLLLQAIGLGWLTLIASPDTTYGQMLVPLLLSGCGLSMALPTAQKTVVGAVKPQEIGQASGAVNALRYFGGVFGIAVAGAAFAAAGSYLTPAEFADGFRAAMTVATVIAFAGAVSGLGMPGRRQTPPPGAPAQAPPVAAGSTGR